MKSLTYFRINNIKFNYTLEFQNNYKNDYWKQNAPLIEYCETVGINIPHYCYHKSLSISGNCRMCLVELKNSPKPIVSCAMSAKSCLNNSEVFTNSPLVKKARENVLEFLLLNHPLDCPICDQGGECDLQDQSLFFGISKKRFYNFKRVVTDKNIGPIVKTVMTRCIHCTRCVRFAGEIAGTEDLGMFGRGLESEIGTYVTKTFRSELSGNIIDLCPVGALTSKPYPFVNRSWELKTVNSVDFSDGFGTDLQVYLKNNSVIKILPGYSSISNNENWISDKTRFAFDGMFSPERVLEGVIKNFKNDTFTSCTWKVLLNEITLTLYFQDHLNKHFYKTNSLYIVFDNNISLEVLNLLILFSKKYPFITLKKAENNLIENDHENSFLMNNQNTISKQLNLSNLCLLVGTNSRYESSQLNVLLRKRYLKGDFKVFSFGSFTDLTIPLTSVGLTLENIQSLVEGNSEICQEFANAQTTIIVSSSIFQRADAKGILKLLEVLKSKTKSSIGSNLNILNLSVNEAGVKYINNFDSLSVNDLNSSNGLYFLNSSSRTFNLKKIINLKLLKYQPSNNDFLPKYCLEQNNGILNSLISNSNSSYKTCNYINLPNNTFFESNATFLNTEGILKKTVKLLSTNKQTKEDWQIIRKMFSCSKKITYLNNVRYNSVINFNNNNLTKFKSFTNFLYVATSGITLKSNTFPSSTKNIFDIKTTDLLKFKKSKIYNTKLKIWINDFYIGGKDPYSRYSSTMVKCSKVFRADQTTFAHIT
jgi:NADH-quinone oxidoreductase chain G